MNVGVVEKPNISELSQVADPIANWKVYRDKHLRFEVKYPLNWLIGKEYYQQGIVSFKSASSRNLESLEGLIYIVTNGESVALSSKNQDISSFVINDLKIFKYKQPLSTADQILPTINFKFTNETDQRKIWMWGIIPSKNQNEFENVIKSMLQSFHFIN